MFRIDTKIESSLDAYDALNEASSTLRGLGFIGIALCESSSVIDEDVCALIANLAYYCAEVTHKAEEILCEESKAIRSARSNELHRNSLSQSGVIREALDLAA